MEEAKQKKNGEGIQASNKTREVTRKHKQLRNQWKGRDESTWAILEWALEMRPTTENPRMLHGTNCGSANNAAGEQLDETNLPLTQSQIQSLQPSQASAFYPCLCEDSDLIAKRRGSKILVGVGSVTVCPSLILFHSYLRVWRCISSD